MTFILPVASITHGWLQQTVAPKILCGTENPHHPIQKRKKKTLTIPTSQKPSPRPPPPRPLRYVPHSHLHKLLRGYAMAPPIAAVNT